MPFVIRPSEDGMYKVVGECYVYDLMDGQAIENWKESGNEADYFLLQ
jgi:hypothetical protein